MNLILRRFSHVSIENEALILWRFSHVFVESTPILWRFSHHIKFVLIRNLSFVLLLPFLNQHNANHR